MQARLYVDTQCVKYEKSLLDSGTVRPYAECENQEGVNNEGCGGGGGVEVGIEVGR
jgi:hypothetical protein